MTNVKPDYPKRSQHNPQVSRTDTSLDYRSTRSVPPQMWITLQGDQMIGVIVSDDSACRIGRKSAARGSARTLFQAELYRL